MARCRCAGSAGTCECHVAAGPNVSITGSGSQDSPWIISATGSASGAVNFVDNNEVAFDVTGQGTPAAPYLVGATLPWVDPSAGSTGNVLTKQPDGSWAPGPPVTAPIGAVATAQGVTGDGSASDPVRLNVCSYDDLKAGCNP